MENKKTSGQGPDKKTNTVFDVILCLAATIWSGWQTRISHQEI